MVEILSKKTLLKFNRLEVILAKAKLDNGKLVNFPYSKFPVTVSIVPVDEDNNVYLCKEWRVAWENYITQIPAGICEDKKEESSPSLRAHKELEEEIGMKAANMQKLATFVVSANSNGLHHLFLATGLTKTKRNLEDDEVIELIKMPLNKAYETLSKSELTPGYTLLGLKLAKEKLKI